MKNKILPYLLTIVLVIVMSSAFVMATTDLDVAPTNSVVSYNDQLIIGIDIDTDDSIGGAQLDVNFDSTLLEAISLVEGGFLSQDGVAAFDGGNNINNTNGKVTFNMMAGTSYKGFNGTGHLVNITFEVIKKNGNSDITIDNIILGDALANPVAPSTIDNGTVDVVTIENVLINEFLSHPSSGNDWVEIYNNDSKEINLSNWSINDSANKIKDIDTILGVGGHALFYVSNKLNNGGDTIKLINDEGLIIDEHTYTTDVGEDNSTGRMHDGLDTWVVFDGALGQPTPNASNNRLPADIIADKPLNEDEDGYFDVSLEITDLDGDELTFTIIDENVNEVDCNIINDTNVTLTPVANWNGVANCTIEVDDGYGTIDKLFYINVANVNDAPIINGVPDQIATEDVNLTLDVTPYIGDVDNETSELIITTNSVHEISISGQVITFNYPNGILEENVTITVSDGSLTDEQNITVTVNSVNDAPTISGVLDQTPIEDVDLELNVTPYIDDVDDDVSSLTITEDSVYATVNGQIITFNYPNGILEENVTITVSDGSLSNEQTIKVTVTPVNDAPIIDSAIASLGFLEGQSIRLLNLSDYVSDVDNADEDITWSTTATTNLVVDIDNTDKMINISAPTTWYGSETFNLTADDGGLTDEEVVTVDVQSILSFSNLVVTIDGIDNPAKNGDTVGDASPDSTFSISLKLNNHYPNLNEWVENIVITAKLDSTIDDEIEISPPFTLDGSKSSTEELTFKNLPLTIEEGSYNLTIKANGTDYKGVVREIEWLVFVDYLTENREVRILDASLTQDTLECYRETDLNVSLVNTGETIQYVNLTISNNDLGIYDSQIIPISTKDIVDRGYTYEWFDSLNAGTYPINVKIKYDDGKGDYVTEKVDVNLMINDCFNIEDQSMDEDSSDAITINISDYVNDPIKDDADFAYDIEDETNTALIDCSIVGAIITCANPAANQTGDSDINVSVISGSYVNYDLFRLTVDPKNDAPAITTPIPNVEFDEGGSNDSIDLDDYVFDVDEDELTWSAAGNVDITVDIDSDNVVTFGIIDKDYFGNETITLTVSDGEFTDAQDILVTVNQLFDDLPYIDSSEPTDSYMLIGDGVDQELSISVIDDDTIGYTVKWYVNGTEKGGLTSYTFNEPTTYVYEVIANVTNTSETESYDTETWNIKVSEIPIADTFNGDTTDFDGLNYTQLQSMKNLTLEKTSYGKIEFLEDIDMTDVVDLDSYVKLERGIAGINSDAPEFDVFKNKKARITMYDLPFTDTPKIYYDGGFSITDGQECTSCDIISYESNTLVFEVNGFSIFWVNINMPPTVSPISDQTAILDEEYRYEVKATDPESDALTYSLTTSPSGMNIDNNGVITWTPTNITKEDVTVSVSDGTNTVTQSFEIEVEEGVKLRISDLDVKIGGDSDKDIHENYESGYKISEKAKPGDKVKFDIEVENIFPSSSDIEIDDINIEVTIKDIDDGDDLEENEDIENDLEPGDDDSVTIEFEIPTLVKDDIYGVEIFVDAEDENGGHHDIMWELTLEVKKDKHELIIDEADLTPSLIRCNRNPALEIKVVNIGSKDEDDVTIEINNDELGLDIQETDIELEEGDDDDSVFEKTYRLKISDDVRPGTYPITITSYYDSRKGDEETVDLTVEKCVETVTPLEGEPVEVITTTDRVTEPVGPPVTEINFRETSEYLTLLAILFVILAGGVIFLIGAAVILLKKKR